MLKFSLSVVSLYSWKNFYARQSLTPLNHSHWHIPVEGFPLHLAYVNDPRGVYACVCVCVCVCVLSLHIVALDLTKSYFGA